MTASPQNRRSASQVLPSGGGASTCKRSLFTRVACALAAAGLFSLSLPHLALAEFGGSGGVDPLESSAAGSNILGYVDAIVAFVTGPFGIALCTIGLLIAVGGMIYRSQRGQPFGAFGVAAVGVILFFIAPQIVTWLGQASGAAF